MRSTETKTLVFPGLPHYGVWRTLQIEHEAVIRWGPYRECNTRLHEQTNLHHIVSLLRISDLYLRNLLGYVVFNLGMVNTVAQCHEDGEAVLGRDVNYNVKTGADDFAEWVAFRDMLSGALKEMKQREELHKAFLLQFILGDVSHFEQDPEAFAIIQDLQHYSLLEARLFNALERLDYIYYAWQAYEDTGDVVILTHVLRRHVPKLKECASGMIDGFSKVMWTPEQQSQAEEIIEMFREMPGPDGEEMWPAYEWAIKNGHWKPR